MSPYSNCNYTFFFIFLIFIGGLIACNYTHREDRSGEYLMQKAIAENSTMNDHDRLFLIECCRISLEMMELTKLGYEKAENNELRELAKDFSNVYRALYDQASELARNNSVNFPLSLLESDQIELKCIPAKPGNGFDKRYCEQMIREQRYMLEAARRFSDDAADTDVRAYARNYAHRLTEMIEQLTSYYKDE
jgi:predicted outer membrane protein